MDQVRLPTKDGSLILRPEGPWCRVSLRAGNLPEVDLGAESTTLITSRLAKVVSSPEKLTISGMLDGVPVAWVLSLAEKHTSLHVNAGPGTTRVFVQDATGAISHSFDLGPDEIAAWRRLLG